MVRAVVHVIWILFGVLLLVLSFSYPSVWWVGLVGVGLIAYEIYGLSQVWKEHERSRAGVYQQYSQERDEIRKRMDSSAGSSKGPGADTS